MIHDIPWQLLERFFANESSAYENQKVKEWIDSTTENAMIFEQLQHFYKTSGSLPVEFIPDAKTALEKVSRRIPIKSRTLQLSNLWWKVAAVLLIGFFSWWFVSKQINNQIQEISSLLQSDTAITNIILPDGSHIWLNAHSSIKYPKKFGNTREVYLDGEAYFEIAHDSKHPFVVRTSNTHTRVIGTKFDICSYSPEKQVIVTVTEGKVGFGNGDKKQVILTANQKGTFDKLNGNVIRTENDNVNFMAWKTLEFHFDQQSLETVFQTLAEVYHFKYQFDAPMLTKRMLTANFNRRPLDEIIQTLSLAADVQISFRNGIYSIK